MNFNKISDNTYTFSKVSILKRDSGTSPSNVLFFKFLYYTIYTI